MARKIRSRSCKPKPHERVVVVLASGTNRFLHIENFRGQLAVATPGNTRGHNAATNAFTVAAVMSTMLIRTFCGGQAIRLKVSVRTVRGGCFISGWISMTPGDVRPRAASFSKNPISPRQMG